MWQCHYCRLPLSLELQHKNRLCPGCGSDIHSCLNCVHYDPVLSTKCDEPHGPWVGDRAAQNECEYFEFRPTTKSSHAKAERPDAATEAERAKEAFRALFRD